MSSFFDLEGVRRRRRKKRRVCNRWHFQAAGQIVPSVPKSLPWLGVAGCWSRWSDTGDGLCHVPGAISYGPGKGLELLLEVWQHGPSAGTIHLVS